jgi:diguanylate cyclase (GGDEF)-like protein
VLKVVAAHPAETGRLGALVRFGDSELGGMARTQTAFLRDPSRQDSALRVGVRQSGLRGFSVDLAAPMVFAERTVGVLAVQGAQRTPAAAKEVLRLIAQLGALASHNAGAYGRMKRSAELDRLTGVLNKATILKTLSECIHVAEKNREKVSLLLFDVDHFKSYNDQNGHLMGDQLLKELALQVRRLLRKEDAFGRFGGEEFLVVLPDTQFEGALIVADKIRSVLAHFPFEAAERQPLGCISVSGGVATFPDHGHDSTVLLRLADEALYKAKRLGRNRILGARPVFVGSEDTTNVVDVGR